MPDGSSSAAPVITPGPSVRQTRRGRLVTWIMVCWAAFIVSSRLVGSSHRPWLGRAAIAAMNRTGRDSVAPSGRFVELREPGARAHPAPVRPRVPAFRPLEGEHLLAALLGLMLFALAVHLPARLGDLYGEPDAARLVNSALLWKRAGLRMEALSQYLYYTSRSEEHT